jgi:hypothetical protein
MSKVKAEETKNEGVPTAAHNLYGQVKIPSAFCNITLQIIWSKSDNTLDSI